MPIDPRLLNIPANLAGIASNFADIDRRLRAVEAVKSYVGDNSIQGSQVAQGTITSANITAGSITAGSLAVGSVTASAIAANAITALAIQAGSINASHIATDTITAANIAAGAITASELAVNSVYTNAIQAGAVTADRIGVANLTALTTSSGWISGGTITGGTFQTATGGARVVMDSLGLRGYALDGVTKVFEVNAGSGVASFTGVATLSGSSVVPGTVVTIGTLPADRIVAASITTNQLAAGAVLANNIEAGAITAQKLSIALPGGTKSFANSTFQALPTITASAPTSWTWGGSGTAATIQADSVFGSVAQLTTPSFFYQDVVLPKGRHIIACWVKGTSLTGNAVLNTDLISGTATLDADQTLTGTFDWTRLLIAVNVTSSTATIRTAGQIASGTGTAQFANFMIESTIGSTLITPDAITTTQILANSILASDINASTINADSGWLNILNAGNVIAAGTVSATQIATGTITADKLNFRAGGGNLLQNSGFRQSTPLTWNAYNNGGSAPVLSVTATGGPDNGPYLNIANPSGSTPTGTGVYQYVMEGVRPTEKYTTSVYARSPTNRTLTVRLDWETAASAFISSTTYTFSATSTWQRFDTMTAGAGVAPALAARCRVYVYYGGVAASETNYITKVQFESGEVASGWKPAIDATVIDGSTITSPLIRSASSGTRYTLDNTGLKFIDAAGNVTTQLSMTTLGMQILATGDVGVSTPDSRRIVFQTDAANGSLRMGDIMASYGGAGSDNFMIVSATPSGTSNRAVARLMAGPDADPIYGTDRARVDVTAYTVPAGSGGFINLIAGLGSNIATGKIRATAASSSALILGPSDTSDFAFKTGPSSARPSSWTFPTPFGPWSNWDPTTWAVFGYYVDQFGMCYIQGLVGNNSGGPTTNPSAIFGAMPTPRDGKQRIFNVPASSGGTGRVDLWFNGSYWDLRYQGSYPNANWLSLDGISYQT